MHGVTPQHFVLSQRKGLVRVLKSSLQRDVSLISVQAAPHGDLDILLVINGVSTTISFIYLTLFSHFFGSHLLLLIWNILCFDWFMCDHSLLDKLYQTKHIAFSVSFLCQPLGSFSSNTLYWNQAILMLSNIQGIQKVPEHLDIYF